MGKVATAEEARDKFFESDTYALCYKAVKKAADLNDNPPVDRFFSIYHLAEVLQEEFGLWLESEALAKFGNALTDGCRGVVPVDLERGKEQHCCWFLLPRGALDRG